MKLLFDQGLSYRLCERLQSVFPESSHVFRLELDRADDLVIWKRAGDEGFVVVSQDADFAELSAARGPPPKVVWLRCGNQSTGYIEALLRRHAIRVLALADDHEIACLELR